MRVVGGSQVVGCLGDRCSFIAICLRDGRSLVLCRVNRLLGGQQVTAQLREHVGARRSRVACGIALGLHQLFIQGVLLRLGVGNRRGRQCIGMIDRVRESARQRQNLADQLLACIGAGVNG